MLVAFEFRGDPGAIRQHDVAPCMLGACWPEALFQRLVVQVLHFLPAQRCGAHQACVFEDRALGQVQCPSSLACRQLTGLQLDELLEHRDRDSWIRHRRRVSAWE